MASSEYHGGTCVYSPLDTRAGRSAIVGVHVTETCVCCTCGGVGLDTETPRNCLPVLLYSGIPDRQTLTLHFNLRLVRGNSILLMYNAEVDGKVHNRVTHTTTLELRVVIFSRNLCLRIRGLIARGGNSGGAIGLSHRGFPVSFSGPVSCLRGTTVFGWSPGLRGILLGRDGYGYYLGRFFCTRVLSRGKRVVLLYRFRELVCPRGISSVSTNDFVVTICHPYRGVESSTKGVIARIGTIKCYLPVTSGLHCRLRNR